ncbi:hypothetical protein ASG90_16265 [Nocardioides sp. Soil797]|nr:hypothetical protein ASG90_16265 [Nocardioides sp. Soil797]
MLTGGSEQVVGQSGHRGLELLTLQPLEVMAHLRIEQLLGEGTCGGAGGGHMQTIRPVVPWTMSPKSMA